MILVFVGCAVVIVIAIVVIRVAVAVEVRILTIRVWVWFGAGKWYVIATSRARRCHAMPSRMSDPRVGVCGNRQAVGGDGRRAFDDEAAGGVVEAQKIQLRARLGVEDIGEGHLRRGCEVGDAGGLDRDVERVLQQAGREHIADEFGGHGADADLAAREWLAVGTDQAVRLDFDRELLALLWREVRRGIGVNADRSHLGLTDILQNRQLQARQVDAEFDLLRGFDAVLIHRGHDGVGDARLDVEVHHHFGEVDALRCVGGRVAVDGEFDVARGD